MQLAGAPLSIQQFYLNRLTYAEDILTGDLYFPDASMLVSFAINIPKVPPMEATGMIRSR